jgi:putative restriction endonuclease
MQRGNWHRDELILAFNLYCKTPFGRIHNRNPEIVALARALGRSPSAVSWKLANFARLDPVLQGRGIAGAAHGSKGEIEVWHEFHEDWDTLAFESERLLAQLNGQDIAQTVEFGEMDGVPREGTEREQMIRTRINQNFFRATILASYNNRCCITDLPMPELLVASHIIPWSRDAKNRLNPRNGLCLNAIHDRAFDRGFLTVTPDYKVKLSDSLRALSADKAVVDLLIQYDNRPIRLPQRFEPDQSLLKFHNEQIFRG